MALLLDLLDVLLCAFVVELVDIADLGFAYVVLGRRVSDDTIEGQ